MNTRTTDEHDRLGEKICTQKTIEVGRKNHARTVTPQPCNYTECEAGNIYRNFLGVCANFLIGADKCLFLQITAIIATTKTGQQEIKKILHMCNNCTQ